MTRSTLLVSIILALPLATPAAPSVSPGVAGVIEGASPDAPTAFSARLANVGRGRNVNRGIGLDVDITLDEIAVTRNLKTSRDAIGVDSGIAVVGPMRPWARRPYYGATVAGVAPGTIIAASTAPPVPSSQLCWHWSNPSRSSEYQDYCYR
jgi:hypothetical protein